MPHGIIEHSRSLPDSIINTLVESIHQLLCTTPTISADAVKTRAVPCGTFKAGVNRGAFVHVIIKVLAGREASLLSMLGKQAHAATAAAVSCTDCTVSVEIQEMSAALYWK